MAKKIRVDELMVQRRLADDIKNAKALIMSGIVYVGQTRIDSGAEKISEEEYIEVPTETQIDYAEGEEE